jgi:DNA-binding PadR family transcriptional regulator
VRVLTPLSISVLALLVERPMHPYEMYQLLLTRHEDQLVKVRPGSLYHTVERLADDELVRPTETAREGNRPERTTYAVTDAGRQALRDRVREVIRQPVNEYPAFPVALSEAHHLPRAEVIALLSAYVADLDDLRITSDKLLGHAAEQVPEAYWLAGDYLQSVRRAELDWIRNLISRLENEELPWPTPRA